MGGFLEGLKTIASIVEGVQALLKFIQTNKDEAWFKESAQIFTELKNAKTEDQRKDLARRMRDAIRGL